MPHVAPGKERINLTIDRAVMARWRKFRDETRGPGLSAVVEEYIGDLLDYLEPIAAEAKRGDRDAAMFLAGRLAIGKLGEMMSEISADMATTHDKEASTKDG